MQIGEAMDLEPAGLRNLCRAGLLHEIGKLGVSNRHLDQPARLTEAEAAEVRRHPESVEALAAVPR